MLNGLDCIFLCSLLCCKKRCPAVPAEAQSARLRIKKINSEGVGLPLAEFLLEDLRGVRLTKRTDANGTASFLLRPGTRYRLRETVPPVGYLLNPTVYRVFVSDEGTVFLNGQSGTQFSFINLRPQVIESVLNDGLSADEPGSAESDLPVSSGEPEDGWPEDEYTDYGDSVVENDDFNPEN